MRERVLEAIQMAWLSEWKEDNESWAQNEGNHGSKSIALPIAMGFWGTVPLSRLGATPRFASILGGAVAAAAAAGVIAKKRK